MVSSRQALTSASSVRSGWAPRTGAPGMKSSIVARAFSTVSFREPQRVTLAPWRRNDLTMASPMPRVPPVTTATLPSKSMGDPFDGVVCDASTMTVSGLKRRPKAAEAQGRSANAGTRARMGFETASGLEEISP